MIQILIMSTLMRMEVIDVVEAKAPLKIGFDYFENARSYAYDVESSLCFPYFDFSVPFGR